MIHCHLGFIPGSSFFMLSLAEVLSEILEMLLMCHPERSVTKSKDLRHYTFTKKDEVRASSFSLSCRTLFRHHLFWGRTRLYVVIPGGACPERGRRDREFPLLFPAVVLCGFENLVGIGDAFGGGRLRVFERVVDFEFLVLAQCEGVIGENFDALDVA